MTRRTWRRFVWTTTAVLTTAAIITHQNLSLAAIALAGLFVTAEPGRRNDPKPRNRSTWNDK